MNWMKAVRWSTLTYEMQQTSQIWELTCLFSSAIVLMAESRKDRETLL
jgi:hypothetical protein